MPAALSLILAFQYEQDGLALTAAAKGGAAAIAAGGRPCMQQPAAVHECHPVVRCFCAVEAAANKRTTSSRLSLYDVLLWYIRVSIIVCNRAKEKYNKSIVLNLLFGPMFLSFFVTTKQQHFIEEVHSHPAFNARWPPDTA